MLGTLALALSLLPAPALAQSIGAATVVNVVDGDTVDAQLASGLRERIRIVGIDAPEQSGQCYAAEATARMTRLVGGQVVQLELDVEQRDRYGRLLAYLWTAAGENVSVVMAREGLAGGLFIAPNGRYKAEIRAAVESAVAAGLGMWGACPVIGKQPIVEYGAEPAPVVGGSAPDPSGRAAPAGPTCPTSHPIKGNRSSMIYHMPGQQAYDRTVPEECFATEADAQAAGYRRAQR